MISVNHELKLSRVYFKHVKSGKKTFEIRKNDRNYRLNDTIEFLETMFRFSEMKWSEIYTSERFYAQITYVLNAVQGLHSDYCIFGINVINKETMESSQDAQSIKIKKQKETI